MVFTLILFKFNFTDDRSNFLGVVCGPGMLGCAAEETGLGNKERIQHAIDIGDRL